MGDLTGRTMLVTGANTGIGRATAKELARAGAKVVLATRSVERTQPVMEQLARETGNDRIEHLKVDLGDLESVRAAAESFVARGEPLHVLVNNAGMAGQRGLTAQGFELLFGVNHLGHFLFTNLLLGTLRKSAPARIVNVSSDAHYRAPGIDFAAVRQPTRTITTLPEYSVSKLCNVLFTQELARRIPAAEVSAYAVHPGVIASDIWRRIPWPFRSAMKLFMRSPEQGAATSVHCATAPELEGVSGRFYVDSRERPASAAATPELAAELWDRSVAWTALEQTER